MVFARRCQSRLFDKQGMHVVMISRYPKVDVKVLAVDYSQFNAKARGQVEALLAPPGRGSSGEQPITPLPEGTPKQIMYLVQQGVVPPLCNLLSVLDAKVITVALEGLENIMRVAQTANVLDRVIDIITDCGGLSAIEELQNHENTNIYNRAVKVLETYFGAEEEDDSQIAPEVVTGAGGGQQFHFGGGNAPASGGFNF